MSCARSILVACAMALALLPAAAHAGPFAQAFLPGSGGARAFALGGNIVCVSEDASGVFLNPARLAFLETASATAGYANLVEGVSSSRLELAYARPFGASIAAPRQRGGAHRLSAGVGVDYQRLELSRGSSYGEGVASIGVALAPINFASFGVAVRGLRSFTDVDGLSASGAALDLGASVAVWPTIEMALVGRNVAGSVTYEDRSGEQPLSTLTLSVALMRHLWIAAEAGVTTESEDGLVYHGGIEVRPFAAIALRGGLIQRVRPEETLAPSAGLGVRTGAFALDYGVQLGADEDLGVRHRVTLGYGMR
jgi:hypothetical protein